MEVFKKKIGPVFLKEDSDAEDFIMKMTALSEKAEGQVKKDIEREIKLATLGLIGEKNIAFELRNSSVDMYIMHDLHFEYNDLQAQIDYLVVTRKRIYVIECKNLIGDVEVDNMGNFIRTYELFGKKVKEGLYSPIAQNERHRLVIKGIRAQEKNFLAKFFFEKNFDDNYKSIVVLANPKTCLNVKFAKKEVEEQVIRADQLIAYIKESDKAVTDYAYSVEDMHKLAMFFIEKNIPVRSDYSRKYETMLTSINDFKVENKNTLEENELSVDRYEMAVEETLKCSRCGAELVLRIASKGPNAGKQFYGCSAFPKCRYIRNID